MIDSAQIIEEATEHTSAVRVTFLIGLHFTAMKYLPLSIAADKKVMAQSGLRALGFRQARGVFNAMLTKLDGLPPIRAEQDEVLQNLMGTSPCTHLLLDDERWASPLNDAFSGPFLYPKIGKVMGPISELLSPTQMSIHLSLLNPAVFLQECLTSDTATRTLSKFLNSVDPRQLSWRDTVDALRAACPEVPLTLWADEDAPLIWPRVLRNIYGMDKNTPINGGLVPTNQFLSPEGQSRLQAFLNKHTPDTEEKFEQVISVFLDKYGDPNAMTPECNIPGWGADEIEAISERYEEDLAYFAELDGIDFITPTADPITA